MGFTYPVMLSLDGVPVLLVGGGTIASRKAEGLVAAGALLTVVAPEIRAELAAVAHRLERRPYQAADIVGHRLVMTATDNPTVNAQVGRDATELGVWVNSADDPANCSFILPAVARRGPVTVAVGTDGSSPALARTLRDRIANEVVTEGVEKAAADLAAQRADCHSRGISTESIDWSDRVAEALARYDRHS